MCSNYSPPSPFKLKDFVKRKDKGAVIAKVEPVAKVKPSTPPNSESGEPADANKPRRTFGAILGIPIPDKKESVSSKTVYLSDYDTGKPVKCVSLVLIMYLELSH